jgi:hypothetical protein
MGCVGRDGKSIRTLLRNWNDAVMEQWNIGFSIKTVSSYIIPLFQYSMCENERRNEINIKFTRLLTLRGLVLGDPFLFAPNTSCLALQASKVEEPSSSHLSSTDHIDPIEPG